MRRPLILSPGHDIHAAAVHWGLHRWGIDACWPRSGSIHDVAVGGVSIGTGGETSLAIEGALSPDNIGSIWHRRARMPDSFPGAPACDHEFLRQEWRLVQQNFVALLEGHADLFWANAPSAARGAENKLVQLNAAIACGLSVPPTLVSNEPAAVANFRARHSRIIYKSFTVHSWLDDAGGAGHIAQAHLIEPAMALDEASIRLCPGIYQRYIDKVADLRVTVIGNRYFANRVGSSAGGAFVDWRAHVACDDFTTQPCELPASLWSKVQALMKRLGLVFGCVDLVLDRNGDLHFLEVNQGGQFLFAETWSRSHALLHAMCAMLATGRADYSIDGAPRLSYQAFLDSDACEEWQRDTAAWAPTAKERASVVSVEPAARVG